MIPGIDDGAKTMDDSIQLISELENIGFNQFITTPHVLPFVWNNTKQTILGGESTVLEILKSKKEKVEFKNDESGKKVEVYLSGKLFTAYIYPDNMEKQSALLQAGCDLFQGYLISRPVTEAALSEILAGGGVIARSAHT